MRLLPKEEKFFDYFEKQTGLIAEGAAVLQRVLTGGSSQEGAAQLAQLELKGDELLRDVSKALQASFVTPLDAEDIHRVAAAFDRVLDELENTAFQINLYQIDRMPEGMTECASLIVKCAEHLTAARAALGRHESTDAAFQAIASYEDQVDKLTARMLTELFDRESDLKYLIKMKDILAYVESASDRFLIAADIIENVYIKNS